MKYRRWWIFEVMGFGRGEGWLFYIGKLRLFKLSRQVPWFWKPWERDGSVYWLRFAAEWAR